MVKYANIDDAKIAVNRWNGNPASIQHIGNSGNSVFSFRNKNDQLQILRFTDPEFRSFDDLIAELRFVNHLYDHKVPVAKAIPTVEDELAIEIECSSGTLICSSIDYAKGIEVQENTPYWSPKFFNEWGRNLALIHEASRIYKPTSNEPKRWLWENENLFANAHNLLTKDDVKSREELNEVIARCKTLTQNPEAFGLIHADHAPQNFRYDLDTSLITAFDFGNCCYHWFVSDLAISLSTVRRKVNREQIKDNILNGYAKVRSLPNNVEELIDLFIRLRVIYVYLSRLYFWSDNPTPEQQKDLELFKNRVHSQTGWSV
ncbi:MAG: phosphotransferase enzyme family protein [Bdellovibrio sp.]